LDTSNYFYEGARAIRDKDLLGIASNVPGTWSFTRKERKTGPSRGSKFPPVGAFRQALSFEGRAVLSSGLERVKMKNSNLSNPAAGAACSRISFASS
jgi:hypothetical protein